VTPALPMLGAVLDALTAWQGNVGMPSYWVGMCQVSCDDAGVTAQRPPGWLGPDVVRLAWAVPSPAEAYEVLQTRGLIPMDYAGRFVCGACGGTGTSRSLAIDLGALTRGMLVGRADPCTDCTVGFADRPATMADLVAWASMGFAASDDGAPGILGHEEAAMQANGAVVCWCPGGRDGFDAVSVAIERNRPMVDYLARLGYRGLSVLSIPPLTPA